MSEFNAKKVKDEVIGWIKKYFEENATPTTNAVIGISGGKDSSVAAALCVEALGKDRVIGVLMPQGEQFDIDCSKKLVAHLGIKSYEINVGSTVSALMAELGSKLDVAEQARVNTPPRIRMTTLYAVAACVGGRVVNTCNMSEDWVGYATRYGDGAGDFSPLSHLTVQEVRAIGVELGLPNQLVFKVPIDGLTPLPDEERLGFTYETLDRYIRTGVCEDPDIKASIDQKQRVNAFKLKPMPAYEHDGPVKANH